jgi:hypothetical protein
MSDTMTLKISFAKALKRMAEGETLKASEIRDKSMLKRFVRDGIIQQFPATRTRFVYRIKDHSLLETYLNANYNIKSLQAYIGLQSQNEATGEESLHATYHTKEKRTVSMPGFFIKSIQPLTVKIHDHHLQLPNAPGTEMFISDPENFCISAEYTVVGVENPEVFRKIGSLINYFKSYEPCLFVLRYMSKGLPLWLSRISNIYLHFGDFDLSGLQIYISEYKNKLSPERCSFFIPSNIEHLIRTHGNIELYEKQRQHTQNINFSQHPEIKDLAEIIQRFGKGLEQEILFQGA